MKLKQAAQSQPEKKNGQNHKPAVLPEQANEFAGVVVLPEGLLGANGDGRIDGQAARLADPRLQTAQRLAIAGQIGKVQGNLHLQHVLQATTHKGNRNNNGQKENREKTNEPLPGEIADGFGALEAGGGLILSPVDLPPNGHGKNGKGVRNSEITWNGSHGHLQIQRQEDASQEDQRLPATAGTEETVELPVDELVERIVMLVQAGPETNSGQIRRLIANLNPETRLTVLNQVQTRVTPEQWESLNKALEIPANTEEGENEPQPMERTTPEATIPEGGAASPERSTPSEETLPGSPGPSQPEANPPTQAVNEAAPSGSEAETRTPGTAMPESRGSERETTASAPAPGGETSTTEEEPEAAELPTEEVPGEEGTRGGEAGGGNKPPAQPAPPNLDVSAMPAPEAGEPLVIEPGTLGSPETERPGNTENVQQRMQQAQARLAGLTVMADRTRAQYQEQGTSAIAQLTKRIELEKTSVLTKAAQTRIEVKQKYTTARETAKSKFDIALGQVNEAIDQARASVTRTQNAESDRLRGASTRSINALNGESGRYDREAMAIGNREAARATQRSNAMADQATAMGRNRVAAATGDESVRQTKAEALPTIAKETADHIRDLGSETAESAREAASDTQGDFDEKARDLVEQVRAATSKALEKMPSISEAILKWLDKFQEDVPAQFDQALEQVQKGIDTAETQSLETVDQAQTSLLSLLDQTLVQGTSAIERQVTAINERLTQQVNTVQTSVDSEAAPDPQAVDTMAGSIEAGMEEGTASFGTGLQMALQEIDTTLSADGGVVTKGFDKALTAVDGQIQQLLNSIQTQVNSLVERLKNQINKQLIKYQNTIKGAVNQTLRALADLVNTMKNEINKALQKLGREIALKVDESLAKNREDLQGLSQKLTAAEREIEARARRGWLSRFLSAVVDVITSVGFIIGIVLLVVVIIIGIIWGGVAALIASLVLLAIFVVYTIVNRFISLWESGAPWYQYLAYIAMLPFIAVADAIGIVGIIEGLVGYDIVTWRRLEEDDAMHRVAGGVVNVVLILITFGLAKVIGPRVAVRTGGPRTPVRTGGPRVPVRTGGPEVPVEPPVTELPRGGTSEPTTVRPPGELPSTEVPTNEPVGTRTGQHTGPGQETVRPEIQTPGRGAIPTTETLARAGEVPDRGGFSRAGRAYQKHGSRNPTRWGQPRGNPSAMNGRGQAILDEIVNSPDTQWTARHHAMHGDIIEGRLPDGRGARWSADGNNFFGFIE